MRNPIRRTMVVSMLSLCRQYRCILKATLHFVNYLFFQQLCLLFICSKTRFSVDLAKNAVSPDIKVESLRKHTKKVASTVLTNCSIVACHRKLTFAELLLCADFFTVVVSCEANCACSVLLRNEKELATVSNNFDYSCHTNI